MVGSKNAAFILKFFFKEYCQYTYNDIVNIYCVNKRKVIKK